MRLTIGIFDIVKFDKLRDSSEYLTEVLTPIRGSWHIEVDDTSEIERLLEKNRIKYNIRA